MSEEILINVTPREIRVAMIENGVLQELMIERMSKRGLVSNIYKGRVCRVLPGMQAAFIDIGLERAAFLHASDIVTPQLGRSKNEIPITELIHEGQTLLVQVIKDPLGGKGARLTTEISIPSRYVVILPYSPNTIGISTRIEHEAERRRLKDIVLRHLGFAEQNVVEQVEGPSVQLETFSTAQSRAGKSNFGFIIRTAAEGCTEEMLRADMDFLTRLWLDIKEQELVVKPSALIYEDLSLVTRTIRDLMGSSIEKVRIDSKETYLEILNFAQNIEDEITKALDRKVQLKSGGYLVVDQTEAMTTIDVNTGAFVGNRNLEETIFKTNLEAAQAIARQLRLRNLGGIIILDFIDMTDVEHRRQVLRTLEKCLEKDHTKSHISEVSSLGLVQMTRKRTRESLEHVLCRTCPTCSGRGSIKTPETICYEIFREILRESRQFEIDSQQVLVIASQEVVDLILDEESASVAQLEEFINRPIRFQVENSYGQEQYDIVLT
jgi:ribonuclease G